MDQTDQVVLNPSDFGDRDIVTKKDQVHTDLLGELLDRDWSQQAFLINDVALRDDYDRVNRYWSSASNKFTDTRLGGNLGINARPQFTRYSDIRVKGRLNDRNPVTVGNVGGNYGMGRYYSESIDDYSQTIYMRFGVPEFNALTTFFSKAFDPNIGVLVRTGRGRSMWYKAGNLIGTVFSIAAFPVLSAAIISGRLISTFFTRPSSKFYSLKPTMFLYWSTVNTLVNTVAVNKGILPRAMTSDVDQSIGNPYKVDNDFLSTLHQLMPDVFTSQYGYDIFAAANKAQRIYNALQNSLYDEFNNKTASDFSGLARKFFQDKVEVPKGDHSFLTALQDAARLGFYTSEEGKDQDTVIEKDPRIDKTISETSFREYLAAEFASGSQFAVFKVDHTGSVSESFSNAATESDLANKINSTSSTMRETRFSFAQGNFGDGIISNAAEAIVGGVKDVLTGTLSGATFGLSDTALGLLSGSGYVDIPKHWQSSSVNLPRLNYKTTLISPYGNPISQMQNIHIPICMLLAGALPLSTGKSSYTSPFLVQIFDRGRCQVRLGMIESLSITRGSSNLPFTRSGNVLAVDVSFSVMDLTSIMHMPVSTGSLFEANMTLDEDNILMDYLAVLGGQDIYSQIYAIPKAKLNLAKQIKTKEFLTSPAYWAAWTHDATTTGMFSYLVPVGHIWDGFAQGSALLPKN